MPGDRSGGPGDFFAARKTMTMTDTDPNDPSTQPTTGWRLVSRFVDASHR